MLGSGPLVASATAVVPRFDQLLHGSKIYVTVTSFIGLAAAIGGVVMLVAESDAGLAVVLANMVVLWLIATIHHSLIAKTVPPYSGRQDAVVGQSEGQGDSGSAELFQCRDADGFGWEDGHDCESGGVFVLDLVDLRQFPDGPQSEKG